MRRRKLRWVVRLTLAALVAAGALALSPQRDRITPENFDRIRAGMSRSEVEAILGRHGDFSSGPLQYAQTLAMSPGNYHDPTDVYVGPGETAEDARVERAEWRNDSRIVLILFRGSGVVHSKYCLDVKRVPQSSWDNFLWHVKRPWRKMFPEPLPAW